jgi:hypothetical protein
VYKITENQYKEGKIVSVNIEGAEEALHDAFELLDAAFNEYAAQMASESKKPGACC